MIHPAVKEALQKGFEKMVNESTIPTTLHARILGAFTKRFAALEQHVLTLERGLQGERGLSGMAGTDGKDGRHGRDGKDGRHGRDGRDGKDGIDGIDGKNADPSEVIEEIKKLQGKDRLHARNIDGLETVFGHQKTTGHGGGGGDTIRSVDLSSQCDGVTKTFTIPNTTTFNAVVLLTGTTFPNFYRPTIDYTWSIANKTITLDAGVAAPQAGQTLILLCKA